MTGGGTAQSVRAGTAADGPGHWLPGSGGQPLTSLADVALCDLDGVAYLGTKAVAGAAEGVAAARAAGVRFLFITNNASRPPAVAAQHLKAVSGIDAAPADFFTSAQAIAGLIASELPARSRVLVIGGDGLMEAIAEAGLSPVKQADESPVAVVQGWGPDVDWAELAEGAYAINQGALYYASNLDATLPTERGFAPGNGALVAALVAATGKRPVTAGKPEPTIYEQAVARCGATRPLVIGDRLDTDLAGARAAGLPGVLALTGVSDAVDLALAPPAQRPTHVIGRLTDLTGVQPAPRREGAVWLVGGAQARWSGDRIEAAYGAPDWLDAVRAVALAAWEAADAGREVRREQIPVVVPQA
ncbi:MAG: HAD-IIA family hydrolase [Bifidobacteriaceae bacterium]|nr:HAD-IIA family hydrolase [Bifidobacteriaceae bacterium]